MKKSTVFISLACIILSVASFVSKKTNRLPLNFTTAMTVGNMLVYGNFTTVRTTGCGVYFVIGSGGARNTLFTIQNGLKQAYIVCN